MEVKTQHPEFRKKREAGEIIQDTVTFIRAEYKNLFRLLAVYVLPFLVMFAVTQVLLQMKITEAAGILSGLESERLLAELGSLYGNVLIIIFFSVFVQSLLIALVYTYIISYITRGRDSISGTEISASLFPNSLKALIAGITIAILSLIGLMFFILPGILIANSLSLAIFISIYEGKGLGYSLNRSWSLVKQQWWTTLSLNIVGLLVIWMVSITVTIPVVLYDLLTGVKSAVTPENLEIPQWRWWLSGLSIVISSMAAVIPVTFLAFQYFNLTEREKESMP